MPQALFLAAAEGAASAPAAPHSTCRGHPWVLPTQRSRIWIRICSSVPTSWGAAGRSHQVIHQPLLQTPSMAAASQQQPSGAREVSRDCTECCSSLQREAPAWEEPAGSWELHRELQGTKMVSGELCLPGKLNSTPWELQLRCATASCWHHPALLIAGSRGNGKLLSPEAFPCCCCFRPSLSPGSRGAALPSSLPVS